MTKAEAKISILAWNQVTRWEWSWDPWYEYKIPDKKFRLWDKFIHKCSASNCWYPIDFDNTEADDSDYELK